MLVLGGVNSLQLKMDKLEDRSFPFGDTTFSGAELFSFREGRHESCFFHIEIALWIIAVSVEEDVLTGRFQSKYVMLFCLWHFVSIVYLWVASHQLTQFKHLKNCPHWYQRSDAGTFVRLPWCQTKQSRLDCTPVNKHEPQKCSLEKGKHLQTIDFLGSMLVLQGVQGNECV